MRRDLFSEFHPAGNFLFFIVVIGVSMFVMNPVLLFASFVSGTWYHVRLKGQKAVRDTLLGIVPLALFSALLMPLFNHQGVTILLYFPTGNPLTKESVIAGVCAGLLLASVVTWFACYNAVFTADKFVYLFGKAVPSLGLVLSMVLRYVPRFRKKLSEVKEVQASFGTDEEKKGMGKKVKDGVSVFSAMLTWSMENAVETADSMRARGYGLPGRTAFSLYRMETRDKLLLGWIFLGLLGVILAHAGGYTYFRTYPTVKLAEQTVSAVLFEIFYFVFCLTPVIFSLAEEKRWRHNAS